MVERIDGHIIFLCKIKCTQIVIHTISELSSWYGGVMILSMDRLCR